MANNRLEVEDSEQRLDRINGLLTTLDSSSSHRGAPETPNNFLLAQSSSEIDGPQTAQLLARVQAFLPQLKAANQEIESAARENPSSVDIESFNGTEQAYIQLSLGLGLFQQQGTQPANVETSSSSSESGTSSEDEESSSTSSTNSEDGDDISSDEDDPQPDLISLVTGIRPMLPLPKSKRRQRITTEAHPGIMELDSSDAVADTFQLIHHAAGVNIASRAWPADMWFSRSGSGRKGVKDQNGDTELPSPSKPLLESEPAGYVYRSRESSPRKAMASTANSTPARIDFPRSITTPTNTTPYDLVFTEAAPARLSISSTGHGGARTALSPTGLLQPPTARSQRNPSTVNLPDEDLEGTDRLFDPFTGRTIAVLNASGRDGLPAIPQGDTLGTQGEGPVDVGGKHRSSGDLEDPVRQKMWDYLARIRSLQAEVAAMHLAMDGHALGDPWGTTRPGVRSRSGSVNFSRDGMKTAFMDGSSTKLAATPEAMPKARMTSDTDSDEDTRQETKEKRAEEFGELDKMFERKQESLKSVMVKLKELSSVVRTYHELENPVITSTRQDTWEPKENVFVDAPVAESPTRAEAPQDILKPLPNTSKNIPRLTLAPILTSSPASSIPSSPLPPRGSVTPISSPINKTPISGRRVSLEMGTGGGRHGYIPVSPGNGPPPLPAPSVPLNH